MRQSIRNHIVGTCYSYLKRGLHEGKDFFLSRFPCPTLVVIAVWIACCACRDFQYHFTIFRPCRDFLVLVQTAYHKDKDNCNTRQEIDKVFYLLSSRTLVNQRQILFLGLDSCESACHNFPCLDEHSIQMNENHDKAWILVFVRTKHNGKTLNA